LITGGGDEELVLDVDEVLTVSDDLAVGVLNRVLKELSAGLL
jgi:O-phosphoseryl-tRNA(Cys) synthetase